MTVISPADGREAEQAVLRAAEYVGPVYIRLGRMAVEDVYDLSLIHISGTDISREPTWDKGVMRKRGNSSKILIRISPTSSLWDSVLKSRSSG